jgi:hypothetical protein
MEKKEKSRKSKNPGQLRIRHVASSLLTRISRTRVSPTRMSRRISQMPSYRMSPSKMSTRNRCAKMEKKEKSRKSKNPGQLRIRHVASSRLGAPQWLLTRISRTRVSPTRMSRRISQMPSYRMSPSKKREEQKIEESRSTENPTRRV